jgi:uridine kinase
LPDGVSLEKIYRVMNSPLRYSPMNAVVNNRVEGLDFRCRRDSAVEFADCTSPSGMRTYVRSLCFILAEAVDHLFPQAELNIEHSVSKGYYCVINGVGSVRAETVEWIKRRMKRTILADVPFRQITGEGCKVARLFRNRGMEDRARLIETAGLREATFYAMGTYANFFYGCLTPSSGYIRQFDLVPYFNGMLLRVPRMQNPRELEIPVKQDKMFGIYRESLRLRRALGVNHVADLNRVVAEGRTLQTILVSEAMQEKQIARIAEAIALRFREGVRIVLISGPSSSGKTTFAQRLGIQLMTELLQPVTVSMDDYFLNRRDTPRNKDGEYDFESLHALDLPYFNSDMQKLLQGEEIESPSFSFADGTRRYTGKRLRMERNSVLIVEGIHALNPALTADIEDARKYRVYVSALTFISMDRHNWIPTTDNRLLRRIVRDGRFRNYSATETLARWPGVREGEDRWIFPYQETADAMFNSAMLYELAALRPLAETMLADVKEIEPEYAEACRLKRFLAYFTPISDSDLPPTSLLREFLGGGSFHY